MKLYDWQILYEHNSKLFNEMRDYMNVGVLKSEIYMVGIFQTQIIEEVGLIHIKESLHFLTLEDNIRVIIY